MNIFRKANYAAMSLAALLITFNAHAHHSFAMFDMKQSTTLEGTVKEFQWTNPHVWIQLLVMDASGKEVEWAIEGGSVTSLTREGWSRKSLKVGDKAKIVIHPLKDGTTGGSLVSASANGKPAQGTKY